MVVTYVLEEPEPDETAYLLANPANAERLLKAVENAKKPEGLVTVNMDKLNELLA